MYGAPEFKQDGALTNLKKGADLVKNAADQLAFKGIDMHTYYNNIPDKASTFKGRALLQFRVEDKRPKDKKYNTPAIIPFKRKIKKLSKKLEPPENEYILQALVVCGTELPSFTQASLMGVASAGTKKQDLRIKVSIGHHEICSKAAKYEKGMCRWNEFLKSDSIKLPADLEQIPDIFVYLVREDDRPVCFTRIKPHVKGKCIGFQDDPEWVLLREDKVIDALYDDDFPGSVLVKLGFGLLSEGENTEVLWKASLKESMSGRPYEVRVHIYQGKNLPAADSNGLSDPYITVNFMGQSKKTAVKKKTLFPSYYETIIFNDVTIPDGHDFSYSPQVNFRLFDEDTFNSDEYLGTFGLDLRSAVVTTDPDADLPDPKWYEFFKEVPDDGEGELLVQIQLIPSLGSSFVTEPKSIIPETKDAFIEVLVIGVRDMSPYNFIPMQAPYLEIEMDSFGTKYKSGTNKSKKPNPSNPNFLEKLIIPVKLPIKSLYSAPLVLTARDTRLGGFSKPRVGVGFIDIVTKIPWCEDTYVAPMTQLFGSESKLKDGRDKLEGGEKDAIPGMNNDATAKAVEALNNDRMDDIKGDDFISTSAPVNLDSYISNRQNVEDTGAGIFGALKHINIEGGPLKSKEEAAFTDPGIFYQTH
jgi:hypothetical protein